LKLLRSPAFLRKARRLVRKNPAAGSALRATLELLADDPFHPKLRTHKLKGKLATSWACSVAHDLRIVFEFAEHEGEQAILLESVGSHNEVY